MFNKSTYNGLFFLVIAFSVVCFFTPVNAQEKGKDNDNAKLEEKIEMLEKKLLKQEDEIAGLRKEINELKKRNPMLALPELKDKMHPPEGRRFNFNGKAYYMIPLNKEFLKADDVK